MMTRSGCCVAFALLLSACGAAETGAASRPLSAAADDGWYVVRVDSDNARFVRRVNQPLTACADGARRAECPVAAVDWSATGLHDADLYALEHESFVVRGAIVTTHGAAELRADAAFAAAVPAARGPDGYPVFAGGVYRAWDNGKRCVAAPCTSITAELLDLGSRVDVAAVDLAAAGASDDKLAAGRDALAAAGVIVDATQGSMSGPAGTAPTLVAHNFYLRVEPNGPAPCGGFVGTPCPDGQYCDITVDDACHGYDLPGVCKPVPELCYELYQPVCGCDGKTYSNDCWRVMARVQRDHQGECAE